MIMWHVGGKYWNISTQREVWAPLPQPILLSVAEVQKTLLTQASGFAVDVVHLSAFPPVPWVRVAYEGSTEYYWGNKRRYRP